MYNPDEEPFLGSSGNQFMNEDEQHDEPSRNKQQIWMEEFMNRADALLAAMLAREALPNDGRCVHCNGSKFAIWRCKDCTTSPLLCWHCMRHTHFTNPLHHVECWTGTHFRQAHLWEVGTYIIIRHHRQHLCSTLAQQWQMLE